MHAKPAEEKGGYDDDDDKKKLERKKKKREEKSYPVSTSLLYTACKRINEGPMRQHCHEIQLWGARKKQWESSYIKFLDKFLEVIIFIPSFPQFSLAMLKIKTTAYILENKIVYMMMCSRTS